MAKNVTSGIIKQVLGRESSSLKVVTTNVDQCNVGGREGVGGGGFQYCPFETLFFFVGTMVTRIQKLGVFHSYVTKESSL